MKKCISEYALSDGGLYKFVGAPGEGNVLEKDGERCLIFIPYRGCTVLPYFQTKLSG
jgi:hypothetical protein